MAAELPFKIIIKAEADSRAIRETTQALEKQTKAAQEARKAEAPTAGDKQLQDARLSFEKKLAEAKEKLTGTTQQTAKAVDNLAGVSMPKLGAAAGVAVVAVGALRQAFDTMLANNQELATSWDNLKGTISTAWGDVVRDVTGNGEGLKSVFDSITIALGGQTEAMKNDLGPMRDYVAVGERMVSQSDKIAKGLREEAKAAGEVSDAMKVMADAQLKQQRATEDADLERRKARVGADDSMSPEAKAQALADIEAERASLMQGRDMQDAAAPRDEAMRRVDDADARKRAAEAALAQQEGRVGLINDYTSARDAVEQAQAQKVEASRRWRGAEANTPESEAAWREREAAAESERAARERFDAIAPRFRAEMGNQSINPEEEGKALEIARKAVEAATSEQDSAERALVAADAKATAEENIAAIKQETQAFAQAEKEAAKRSAEAAGADVSAMPSTMLKQAPVSAPVKAPASDAPEGDSKSRAESRSRRGRRGSQGRSGRSVYRSLDEDAGSGRGRGGNAIYAPGMGGSSGGDSGGTTRTTSRTMRVGKDAMQRGLWSGDAKLEKGQQGKATNIGPLTMMEGGPKGAEFSPGFQSIKRIMKGHSELLSMMGSLAQHMETGLTSVSNTIKDHGRAISSLSLGLREQSQKGVRNTRQITGIVNSTTVPL